MADKWITRRGTPTKGFTYVSESGRVIRDRVHRYRRGDSTRVVVVNIDITSGPWNAASYGSTIAFVAWVTTFRRFAAASCATSAHATSLALP